MKINYRIYYILFALFSVQTSYAQLPEPLVLEPLKTAPTLEDKLKAKAKELELVRSHLATLLFKDQINTTAGTPPTYPVSAGIYSNGSFNTNALSGYDQLLTLSRSVGDRKKEAEALSAFGDLYAVEGQLEKSVQYYKEALQVKETLKNRQDVARTSYRLASVLNYKKDYQDALVFYDYAARTASEIRNYSLLALTYSEIGKVKFAQNNFKEAEALFMKKALPLYTRMGDRRGRITCFENLAKLYQQQKRYSEAKWFYIQANLLGRKIQDEGAVISSLINLGHIKNAQGDLDLALRDFKEAETLASLNNDVPKLIEIKSDLGDLYHRMGDRTSAVRLIDEYSELKNSFFNTGK